jgi:drug/metabolite transporter (DMT)-like permease
MSDKLHKLEHLEHPDGKRLHLVAQWWEIAGVAISLLGVSASVLADGRIEGRLIGAAAAAAAALMATVFAFVFVIRLRNRSAHIRETRESLVATYLAMLDQSPLNPATLLNVSSRGPSPKLRRE